MDDAAREARNAYRRAWYAKNKDRQREYTRRYWERQAKKTFAAEKRENSPVKSV